MCARTSIPPAKHQANQNNIKPAESQTSCDDACHAYTIIVVASVCKTKLCWRPCLQLPLLQPLWSSHTPKLSWDQWLGALASISPQPTMGHSAVKTASSHSTSATNCALWAANEFKNLPGNRKAFHLIKLLKRKTTICCCWGYMSPFVNISMPCLILTCLQVRHGGVLPNWLCSLQPCRVW